MLPRPSGLSETGPASAVRSWERLSIFPGMGGFSRASVVRGAAINSLFAVLSQSVVADAKRSLAGGRAGTKEARNLQPDDPGQDLTLGGRYRIHPDKPLPNHDTQTAFAVEADDQRMPSRPMIGLVCKPGLIPRLDVIPQLSRLTRLPMINPVDVGPVNWPETGGRRFVVLFERATGEPLQASLDQDFTPWREDQVFYKIIKPVLPALKELSNRSIRHRAIRADNVFYADDARQAAVLGECVSGPPGMSQPVLYEPTDAGMADPAGRGQGTLGDDLYAFGVLIVVLLSGGNPVKGMSDAELVGEKISKGSYAALIHDLPLSLRMIEPLRGLLCDDPKERWTVSDLELWIGGRQLSPKQPMLPAKANRTIPFNGTEYLTRASLSHAMGQHWDQAAKLVTSGELENWLRRSHGDEESANSVRMLLSGGSDGPRNEDRLVSGALIILDATHPLRYRGISARIDGLATMLAVNYGDETFRATFSEMMRAKLPQIYLQSIEGKGPDLVPLMKAFEMINYFMERPQIGNGLERALYEANRGWPCQSPLIADEYVCELEDLLPALERAVRRGSTGERLVDRHIAGFCAARSKSLIEMVNRHLALAPDETRSRLGILTLYANVQKTTGHAQRYPALTAWLAAMMTPVIESYHNRALRERLAKEVERVGGKGDPAALLAVLDNPEEQHADMVEFSEAQRRYGLLENSINWLEHGGLTALENVRSKSRQAATFISAMLAGATVVVLSILYVT